MSLDATIAAIVAAAVDKRVAELRRPEFVNQRNVEQVLGLPRRDYLRLARERAWASGRERRLVISRTEDVARYLAARITAEKGLVRQTLPDAESTTFAKARTRIRRVG